MRVLRLSYSPCYRGAGTQYISRRRQCSSGPHARTHVDSRSFQTVCMLRCRRSRALFSPAWGPVGTGRRCRPALLQFHKPEASFRTLFPRLMTKPPFMSEPSLTSELRPMTQKPKPWHDCRRPVGVDLLHKGDLCTKPSYCKTWAAPGIYNGIHVVGFGFYMDASPSPPLFSPSALVAKLLSAGRTDSLATILSVSGDLKGASSM